MLAGVGERAGGGRPDDGEPCGRGGGGPGQG